MTTITGSSPAVIDVDESTRMTMEEKPKPRSLAIWCAASWKAILAEMMATAMLVLFGCMSCIQIDGLPVPSPMYVTLTFGFTVLFNIQIFGHISGAHMNPAVTLAGIIFGNMSIPLGAAYALAQILGAIIGYGILIGISPSDMLADGICALIPNSSLTNFQALAVETILTGTLVFVCCGIWDPVNAHKQDSIPLRFGLTIVGLSLAGGPLTGASMNPARSLSPAIWTGYWTAQWVYWVGPFVGAILASLIYKFAFLKK